MTRSSQADPAGRRVPEQAQRPGRSLPPRRPASPAPAGPRSAPTRRHAGPAGQRKAYGPPPAEAAMTPRGREASSGSPRVKSRHYRLKRPPRPCRSAERARPKPPGTTWRRRPPSPAPASASRPRAGGGQRGSSGG